MLKSDNQPTITPEFFQKKDLMLFLQEADLGVLKSPQKVWCISENESVNMKSRKHDLNAALKGFMTELIGYYFG